MRIAFFAIIIIFLSSCGFKPMLAKNENSYQLMDQVRLLDVQGKDKLKLKRIIIEKLELSKNTTPLYDLKIKVDQEASSIGIMKDSQATRYRVKTNLSYNLLEISNQKVLDTGSLYLYNSYDVADSEFANFIADHYVSDNMLIELSEELKNRLILVLSTRK